MRGKVKKMTPKGSSKNEKAKKKYRVTNAREYNESLERRGDITIYITEEVRDEWMAVTKGKRKKGHPLEYSDLAIKTVFMVSKVFKQALRQTRGLMKSLFKLMNIDLPMPQVVRRISKIKISPIFVPRGQPFSLMFDSSGLKCKSGKEWQKHKHGGKVIRIWRKAHINIDNKGVIVDSELTDNHVSDLAQGKVFVDRTEQKPAMLRE